MTENELTEVAMDILKQVRYFLFLGKTQNDFTFVMVIWVSA